MKNDIPQILASDRLAFLDAHKVFLQIDGGPMEGYYISSTSEGWEVGRKGKTRMEPTFSEAVDAIMEKRHLDSELPEREPRADTDPEWD
jgi:hypothetical protein